MIKIRLDLINSDLNGLDLTFGGSNTDGQLFNGSGDCARIWNVKLTPEQITYLAAQELAGIDINP